MLQDSHYSLNPLTLNGAPRQKKRFDYKNLHYIRNAEIFTNEESQYLTENKIRFNNSPEKWK